MFTASWTRGLAAVALLCSFTASVRADNWPQWREPAANGVADSSAPRHWTPDRGVRWKAALAGQGTSSPVVWGGRVFLTMQIGAGPIDERGAQFAGTRRAALRDADGDAVTLAVQAFRLADGGLVWEHRLAATRPLPPVHRNHSLATPSVVTDGTLLFVWFGTGQLISLDLDGAPVWDRHLGEDYGRFDVLWGHGSSPMLHDELLILQVDHPRGAYLLSLDKRTGAERWKIDRGPGLRSYSTPLVVSTDGGVELIVNSSNRIDACDPRTGALLWHAGLPVELAIGMPVHRDGILFTSRGYSSSPYLAVATGGRGEVSETHLRWRHASRAPYVSSLLLHEGLLYMATENGVLTVTDAESGDIVWRERLGGVFTASPVSAGSHLYFLNESGETVVLAPGREPEVIARNPLEERSLASPAIMEGQILIRTDQHLWCIDGQGPAVRDQGPRPQGPDLRG